MMRRRMIVLIQRCTHGNETQYSYILAGDNHFARSSVIERSVMVCFVSVLSARLWFFVRGMIILITSLDTRASKSRNVVHDNKHRGWLNCCGGKIEEVAARTENNANGNRITRQRNNLRLLPRMGTVASKSVVHALSARGDLPGFITYCTVFSTTICFGSRGSPQ